MIFAVKKKKKKSGPAGPGAPDAVAGSRSGVLENRSELDHFHTA